MSDLFAERAGLCESGTACSYPDPSRLGSVPRDQTLSFDSSVLHCAHGENLTKVLDSNFVMSETSGTFSYPDPERSAEHINLDLARSFKFDR